MKLLERIERIATSAKDAARELEEAAAAYGRAAKYLREASAQLTPCERSILCDLGEDHDGDCNFVVVHSGAEKQ